MLLLQPALTLGNSSTAPAQLRCSCGFKGSFSFICPKRWHCYLGATAEQPGTWDMASAVIGHGSW